jgi:cytochrome b involved in lipid metabolism
LKKKFENAPRYTMEEVAMHNSELDCWTVIDGKIYNIAPFVSQHPGGKKILKAAGKDGSDLFSKKYIS